MPGKQFFPADDTFDEGSPVYGDVLQMMVGIQPWSTNPETATGYSLKVGWGHAYNGYSIAGNPHAAMTKQASVPDDDRGIFTVYREIDLHEPHVRYWPKLRMLAGDYDSDTVRICGLCARVSGGTLTTPGGGDHSDRYYADVSGYFFLHVKQSAQRHKLFLLRVDIGVVTVLDEVFVDTLRGGQLYGSQSDEAELPRAMRMTISQPSTTATITCYRQAFVSPRGAIGQGNPGSSGTLTEDTVFTYVDSSPPANGGRVGFGLQLSKVQAGIGTSVLTTPGFEVRDFGSSDALVMRDRFRRDPSNASRQLNDPLSQVGYSLGSSFSGDSQSEAVNTFKHFGHLLRDAGSDRLDVGSTPPSGSGQVHGWYMSTRPARTVQQHRSASFTVINSTTEDVRCGIMLRGAWFPQSGGTLYNFRARASVGGAFRDYRKQGYLALVKYEPAGSPQWELEIRSHRKGGSTSTSYRADLIASLDLTSLGLAVGTPFTLALEVRNFDGAQFGGGTWPVMRVKINGSVQTPVALLAGVSENDDWIIDSRTSAVDDGLLEGFYVDVSAVNASQLARVDTWTQEALSDAPNIGEEDQASVVLAAETAALTGTLVTPLSWPIEEEWGGFEPLAHRFETGQVQTYPTAPGVRRFWSVTVEGATTAERVVVRDFFNDHKAAEIPFNWVHPVTGEALKVKLLDGEFAHEMLSQQGDGFEGYALRLVEVFDHEEFNPVP